MYGGVAESRIVTRLSGCKLCTSLILPFRLGTQNHAERYDELEGSYTPLAIFVFRYSSTSRMIPGGTWKFRSEYGVCSIVAIRTPGKLAS